MHISFAYYLGVFVFVALVPYMRSTLDLLKPSTVIKVLAEGITEKNILFSIGEAPEKIHDKDPIQPIIDIVRASLVKHDSETAKTGLIAIGYHTDRIIKRLEESKEPDDKAKLENVLKYFFTHIRRAGKALAFALIGDVALFIITTLHKNGMVSVGQKLEDATWWAVLSIGRLGEVIVELKFDSFVIHTVQSLEEIGKTAVKNFEDVTWWVVFYLGKLGELSAGKKLEYAALQAAISLKEVGNTAAEHKLEHAKQQAEHSIKKVKEAADKQQFKFIEEEMVEKSRKQMQEALEKIKELHKYSSA